MDLDFITVFLYSYLLGSVPFGLIVTRIFLKEDVRKIGSGNIGATNVLRTGNKYLAAITLLLDVVKGYLSIYISLLYFNELIYLSALVCFIGHIFPIWLNFKGGKGVATYLGIIFAISFKFGILFCSVWLVVLLLFKYSSLASILSTLVVFLYSFYVYEFSLNFYFFGAFIIIFYTHKDNIIRLKNKSENKIKF